MLTEKTIENVTTYCAVPAVGCGTALLTAKVAIFFGRSFMQIGPQNLLLLGLIGAVHNFASYQLSKMFHLKQKSDKYLDPLKLILGTNISGATLFFLSLLAARVNLISTGLTPFGCAALIATGFIGNYLTINAATAFLDKYDLD